VIPVDATIVGKVVDFFIPENCAGGLQPLAATPHSASTWPAAAMRARKMNAVEARAMAPARPQS